MRVKQPIGPVLEALGATLPPWKSGWTKMLCPFHDDHTLSGEVNFETERFRCFAGCTEGSVNAVQLLMDQEGLNREDAVTRAEAITGVKGGQIRERPRRTSDLLSRLARPH